MTGNIVCSNSQLATRNSQLATRHNSAFTLIELSIVIVIIGLVAGGVLFGKDLIQAAEVRKQISQFEKLETEINTFRVKYNCLAGDCPNATQFLSSYGGYGIYDGNGDGIIKSPSASNKCPSGSPVTFAVANEASQVFHHINSSGIGSYDNKTRHPGWEGQSISIPLDVFGGGMLLYCLEDPGYMGITVSNNFIRGTAILIGAIIVPAYDPTEYATSVGYLMGWNQPTGRSLVIPSTAARSIDIKIDDGLPSAGKVGVYIKCNWGAAATSYSQIAEGCNVSMVKKLWE